MYPAPNPIPTRRLHPPAGATKNQFIADTWRCPVCAGHVHNCRRAGRPRIYCTNACRQRAYRWRRDNGARLYATPADPPERATYAYGKHHALRSQRDPASRLQDTMSRELTICGVLARPSRYGKFAHDDFVLNSQGSCVSCIRLVTPPGAQPPPLFVPGWLAEQRRLRDTSASEDFPYRPVRHRLPNQRSTEAPEPQAA